VRFLLDDEVVGMCPESAVRAAVRHLTHEAAADGGAQPAVAEHYGGRYRGIAPVRLGPPAGDCSRDGRVAIEEMRHHRPPASP